VPVSIESGKAFIRNFVGNIKHERMLDIGAGCGTYAKIFPEARWTGVEVWEPYIEEYGLRSIYHTIIIDDAREVDYASLERFDVAIAGDVLEHMSAADARALLDKLQDIADAVIVSIPLGHHPQGAVNGNVYETHIEDWNDSKVKEVFGDPIVSHIDGIIGVYVFSKHIKRIPRVIHIVWVGDEKKRPDQFIGSWREKNPEWKVRIWGNDDLTRLSWDNKAHMMAYYNSGNYHGVADLMRYEILFREGGFCVDADSICVSTLDDNLFDAPIVCCYENEPTRPGMIAVGYIAALPGLHFFENLIREIQADQTVPSVVPWIATGPKRFTATVESHKPEGIKILPSYTFIPEHFDAPPYTGDEKIYARQMWGTTKGTYGNMGIEKKKLKICVYAISKNEAHFVKRFADSAREADLIMVADTGSSDNTVEECKKNGVTVHEICITPWRFDHARNAAIALIPRDIDICISLDLDEVMEPGWREEIERVWAGNTTRLRYFFDWGCGIKFLYEKIHARHGYYWHHPCHEYPRPDGRITEVYAHTDKLLVSHHPDPAKSRGQYLDLLELSVKEDPRCPRNAFYYARELSFHAKWDESIAACKKYLSMPEATWQNERCYAMRVLGKCYEMKGDKLEAETWYQRAAAEAPNTREPWCALSMLYYSQAKWLDCYTAAMRALSIKNRELVYTCDPAVWGSQPHDLAAIAAWNLGMKETAAEQGALAVDLEPTNSRLKENLLWFRGEKG